MTNMKMNSTRFRIQIHIINFASVFSTGARFANTNTITHDPSVTLTSKEFPQKIKL